MKMTVLGDQLAILNHAKLFTPAVSDSVIHSSAIFKPPASVKLPNAQPNMTHPHFCKFLIDWNVCKRVTGLPLIQVPDHLYSACDEAVQNSLINSCRNFLDMDEATMLEMIGKS